MNLTGKWNGRYTYGKGYSASNKGKSEPFEFDIIDSEGVFTGSCIDNVVKSTEGNESYITGNLKAKKISFKKRYKFQFAVDGSGTLILPNNIKSDGVDYKGRSFKKFFSRVPYFSGTWSISGEFLNENNFKQTFVCEGKWKMSKI